jgi:hypothetical protein
MAKDPAFLFYPGDYLRDTQCLSEACQVAYDRIMCEHMRNICITQEQLNFFTKRLTAEEKAELIFILKKMPDGFQIEWVAESIVKRKEYSNSRSKNRTFKPKKDILTYVPHMENENEIVNESIVVVNNVNAKFKKMLLESESVIGSVCFALKISNADAEHLRDIFTMQAEATNEHHNNYSDYSKHFINWAKLNKGLLTEKKSKTATTITVAERIRKNLENAE